MPRFAYEALDAQGRMIQGIVEAPNVEAVIEDLRNVRYTVTNVKEQRDLFAAVRNWCLRLMRVRMWSMVVFTRQFATIFNSGVPLVRGLQGLARQSFDRRLQMALTDVYTDIKNGVSIHRALSRHPDVFSPVYIALVRAGEMSGSLGEILDRTAGFLERDFLLRKKVQAATTYPILVFLFTVIVTGCLVVWVFPTFTELLQGLNVALPWPTRALIFISDIASNLIFIMLALLALGVGVVTFRRWGRTRSGRKAIDQALISVAIIGPINRKVIISRFCRTLSTLLQSGVPLLHALEIVSKVTGNEVVTEILDEIIRGVKSGMKLSQPLHEYHLFPPIVPHMVKIGEETGNLPDILAKLAGFYDSEVEAALNAFSSLIEPIMICFMGAVVCFVLVAVFLPVYQILQNF